MPALTQFEKNAFEKAHLNIKDLTVCSDDTTGSIWLTLQTATSKVNISFDGPMEALRRLYSDCISHSQVLLFGFN